MRISVATLWLFCLTQTTMAQIPSLWNGGVENPDGQAAIPSVRYESLSGTLFLDSRGVNHVRDSTPLEPGSNYIDVAGDDVAMLSLIIEGPQPIEQLALDGFQFGILWTSQYFANRQQLFGITAESEFLTPGLHPLYRYVNSEPVTFGEAEIGVNFGPTIAGDVIFGQVEVLSVDLNQDGRANCADVNALSTAVSSNNQNPTFDLDGDDQITRRDLDLWLELAGTTNNGSPFLPGDLNLDGVVDVSDFNGWNQHKFTSGTAWCSGDLNTDGVTDVSDFNIWNEHKFQSSVPAAVPEPESWWFLLAGLVAFLPQLRWKPAGLHGNRNILQNVSSRDRCWPNA